jgi:hypothetical protein
MMNTRWHWRVTALFVLSPCVLQAAPSNPYPVAGFTPYQRPANAPTLVVSPVLDAKQALHGVSAPFPESLKFLSDQGRWFNPFKHPGIARREFLAHLGVWAGTTAALTAPSLLGALNADAGENAALAGGSRIADGNTTVRSTPADTVKHRAGNSGFRDHVDEKRAFTVGHS